MESAVFQRACHALCPALVVVLFVGTAATSLAASPVAFDVQPVVACRDATVVEKPVTHADQRLIEVQFQVSALLQQQASVLEYFYRVDCQPEVEIVDYSPKTELMSRYAENISVEDKDEDSQSVGLSLNGNLTTFAAGSAGADVGAKQQKMVRYALKPPMETVTASGTLNRGQGVYFKLRSTPQQTLEGAKKFSLILRVPKRWQADYVVLTCQARCLQRSYPGRKTKVSLCASQRFLVMLHEDGNDEAKRAAQRFSDAEQHLRATSVAHDAQLKKRAYPSFVHRLGAAIDIYEPRIPQDWLHLVMVGKIGPRHEMVTVFPSEVRSAIHEFWESQSDVTRLRNTRTGES